MSAEYLDLPKGPVSRTSVACEFQSFAKWELRNISAGSCRSLGLDARELHHLGPLLGLVGNEFPEFGRGHGHRHIRKAGKPFLHLRIGKTYCDLAIDFVNNLGRRALWRAHAEPCGNFVARDKLAYGRKVR